MKERNLFVMVSMTRGVKMGNNDPVYGKHKYENKCKVTFEFECLAPADVTKCRFWSGTVKECDNWERDDTTPKGQKAKLICKLKYAHKWAILRKLKDYYGEDILEEVRTKERER